MDNDTNAKEVSMFWTILVLVGILWRMDFVCNYATRRIKKVAFYRSFLTGMLALVCLLPNSATAAQVHEAALSAAPGTLIRWSAPATKFCGMGARHWPALKETCYYPIDLLHKPGLIKITRSGDSRSESALISVEPFPYGTQEIELGDIPQANPSPKDLQRDKRERNLLIKVWHLKEGPAMFELPLGKPAKPLPEGKDFGAKRIFNGKPAAQPHTGADYLTPEGTTVLAVADGTVMVAKDLFFEGNAVFIDHGDGLVTMSFHLSELSVKAGQKVHKGDAIGRVGTTGRSTGPHLFFGVRWHGARIDPRFLFEDPSKIPAVNR